MFKALPRFFHDASVAGDVLPQRPVPGTVPLKQVETAVAIPTCPRRKSEAAAVEDQNLTTSPSRLRRRLLASLDSPRDRQHPFGPKHDRDVDHLAVDRDGAPPGGLRLLEPFDHGLGGRDLFGARPEAFVQQWHDVGMDAGGALKSEALRFGDRGPVAL